MRTHVSADWNQAVDVYCKQRGPSTNPWFTPVGREMENGKGRCHNTLKEYPAVACM